LPLISLSGSGSFRANLSTKFFLVDSSR
jgi:hypothetical protein